MITLAKKRKYKISLVIFFSVVVFLFLLGFFYGIGLSVGEASRQQSIEYTRVFDWSLCAIYFSDNFYMTSEETAAICDKMLYNEDNYHSAFGMADEIINYSKEE